MVCDDAWDTFRNGSGVNPEWMQNVADQDSCWAGMPCCFDCGGWPVGFDTMDGSDAGQPASAWVRRSRQFLANRFMHHGACSNGGMPMRPMLPMYSARPGCLQRAVALPEQLLPLLAPCGAHGRTSWSRPMAPPAGPMSRN